MTAALWSLAIDIEAWPLGKPDVRADAESPEGKMHCPDLRGHEKGTVS